MKKITAKATLKCISIIEDNINFEEVKELMIDAMKMKAKELNIEQILFTMEDLDKFIC